MCSSDLPYTRPPDASLLYPYERHLCVDEVNKKNSDNPLTITFEGRQIQLMNGLYTNGSNFWSATNYRPAGLCFAPSHISSALSSIPSIGTVATAVIARSNPSRPAISIPNYLYELKDLPGMIRDIGRLKHLPARVRNLRYSSGKLNAKEVASHYLSYQMGWRPLIEDLQKLLGFQALVDKKLRELKQLNDNGGIQRKVRDRNWSASAQDEREIVLDSVWSTGFTSKETRITHVERWGTVRWSLPNRPDSRYSSKELARLARDLTFGMKGGISGKQAWDAIPWTWLIGWFTNFGTWLQANDNRIPLVHSKPCIMTKSETTYRWIRSDLRIGVTGGEGAMGYSTKERVISSGSITASIPMLGKRHFAILSALAIQRKR